MTGKKDYCQTCFNRDVMANHYKCRIHRECVADGEYCKDYQARTGHEGVDLSRLPSPEEMRRIYEERR